MRGVRIDLSLVFLLVFLCLNIAIWTIYRGTQAHWINVPPAPPSAYARGMGLGDSQFAYRSYGLMLQNLGDSGGVTRPLQDYNYDTLSRWFLLQDRLDPNSSYIPYLASYYFGAVQTPESLRPLIAYLAEVGKREDGKNWKWLAQAVYLAHYRLADYDLALEHAQSLASLKSNELPAWARNMDSIMLNVKGEKEAAYQIMLQTLQSEREHMKPEEILFMIDYICKQILDESQAAEQSFCSETQDQ